MQTVLAEHYGLHCPDLIPLAGGKTNRLWRCGHWVVKRSEPGRVDRQQAERALRLQAGLAAAGLPVPEPRSAASGNLWVDLPEGLLAVMEHRLGERRRRGELTAVEAANMGRTIARLHRALVALAPAEAPRPAPADPTEVVARWRALKAQAEALRHPGPFDAAVIQFADYVAEVLSGQAAPAWGALPWHTCHMDLHLDNLLFDTSGSVSAILDFDNAAPWWPGHELMMAWNLSVPADPGRPPLNEAGKAFFAAYALEAGWSGEDLAQLPSLYWHGLMANTWPAPQRYRSPDQPVHPDWVEILTLRYRMAMWLGENREAMAVWLRCSW